MRDGEMRNGEMRDGELGECWKIEDSELGKVVVELFRHA